ncbi:MAG TPA: cupin domain-containing protein [Gaiellaceae bacterium]|jgi:mannose-6-phosphate isomerase-like protein (cupin superfamily)|nr:cupin domain-containing protein [Gaiellaceae bacterium]
MNLREIELAPFSVGDDPTAKGRIALPVCADDRALTTVVYLEVDPGDHIPLHTHSAEETLVFLEGTGQATAGAVDADVSAGSIVVAPAFEMHGFANTGVETLKAVGFFGTGALVTTFDAPVAPFGTAEFSIPLR